MMSRRNGRRGLSTSKCSVLLTLGFVFYFAFSPLAATAFEHNNDVDFAATEHYDDGAPCPDGDGDMPCSRDCSCLCCPGHKIASVAFVDALSFIQIQPTLNCFPVIALTLPNGISQRVFRPPRG